ncbi:ATP-binding protein [Actinoallomurus sp. NPDC052308]|uniref:ATP-binding protein n=1 Tax=Actinoallomurus sp. NPDC052308 TaxID=3155530 RepID=UPI003447B374
MIPGPDIDRGEKWRPFGGRVTARRPGMLRWERHFAGTPEQVGAARTFVSELFADAPFAGNAAWITGELATNAIRHSASGRPGGTFTVALCRWPTFGEIHVIDAGGPKEPRLPGRDPVGAAIEEGDDLPESGLGLYGIGALADHYGTYRHRDGSRVVWARLRSDRSG